MYTGKGLHKKAVDRFSTIVKLSASKLEISSLTKQLKLMFNLLGNYVSEIPIAYWENLSDAIQKNEELLRINIQQEESPMKKERADIALNLLLPALQNWIRKKKLKTA